MRAFQFAALLLIPPSLAAIAPPAAAQSSQTAAEAPIRATIARWYAELSKKETGRPHAVTAPGFIDASPHFRYLPTASAALGPRVFDSLPARALKFAYDVDLVIADARFAKVRVWERGYFYAAAVQTTYETAASTLFVLERQPDDRWLILAHQSLSSGIPPTKTTNPLPDLRALYYATEGKGRDPAKDAEAARRF